MKKQIKLFAFALLFTGTSFAQEGSILVGGSISIASLKEPQGSNGEDKTTEMSFNPVVGYQFSPNLTAGIIASIGSNKNTDNPGGGNPITVDKITSFGIGPFLRYTKELSSIFSVYGQLEGLFGSEKNKFTSPSIPGTIESKQSFMAIGVYPAVFVNLKNSFGLNFSFGGLAYASVKPDEGEKVSVFSFTFGQTANIGVSKNFGGGKKKK